MSKFSERPLNAWQSQRSPAEVQDAAFRPVAREVIPPTQRELTVHDWLTNYKFGRKYDAMGDFLSANSLEETFAILKERLERLFGDKAYESAANLEQAYVSILDEGLLEQYEAEAAKNAKKPKRSVVEVPAFTPAPLASPEELARLKKLASTKKGLKQLRHEALYGNPVKETVPFTGTAHRF